MPHPPVDPSQSPEGLSAGVPADSLPDGLATEAGHAAVSGRGASTEASPLSKWWPTRQSEAQGETEAGVSRAKRGGKWRSTATEELEAFRPVPVVGRLPWKMQHLTATLALVVTLLVLLAVAAASVNQLRKRAGGADDTAAAILAQASASTLSGQGMPARGAIQAAMARMSQAGGDGRPHLSAIEAGLSQAEQVAAVREAAQTASTQLNAAITAMAPQWRAAGNAGQWSSPDAVNFAQALAEVRYLAEVTTAIAAGQPRTIDDRFPVARQNVEQSIRTYAQSNPGAGPLLEAWRSLARGWSSSSASLDAVLGQRQAWNTAVTGHQASQDLQRSVLMAGGRLGAAPPADPSWLAHAPIAIVMSSVAVALALSFLTWVGWKQQRWQSLHEMAGAEQVTQDVESLVRKLRRYRPGAPANIRSSVPLLQPLAETITATLGTTRVAYANLSEQAGGLARDSLAAAEATGELVALARQGQEGAMEVGQDILAVTQALQDIIHEARTALGFMGDEPMIDGAAASGLVGAVQALDRIETKIKDRATRLERLHGDARQVHEAARGIGEEADRLAVVAIQAAIQAARAGEAGQGFRVIADHLKELSERLASSARRTGVGAESLLSDLASARKIEDEVLADTTAAQQHQEVAQEWLLSQEHRTEQLRQGLGRVATQALAQEGVLDRLADRTSEDMARLNEFQRVSQLAAEAASVMASAAASLDTSLSTRT